MALEQCSCSSLLVECSNVVALGKGIAEQRLADRDLLPHFKAELCGDDGHGCDLHAAKLMLLQTKSERRASGT